MGPWAALGASDYFRTPQRRYVSLDGSRFVSPPIGPEGGEPCRLETDAEYEERCELLAKPPAKE